MSSKTATVITPVAALTPASPNIVVAASVTRAVAPILTTLTISKRELELPHYNQSNHKKQVIDTRVVRCANKYGCQEPSNIIAEHFEHTILRLFLS